MQFFLKFFLLKDICFGVIKRSFQLASSVTIRQPREDEEEYKFNYNHLSMDWWSNNTQGGMHTTLDIYHLSNHSIQSFYSYFSIFFLHQFFLYVFVIFSNLLFSCPKKFGYGYYFYRNESIASLIRFVDGIWQILRNWYEIDWCGTSKLENHCKTTAATAILLATKKIAIALAG